MDSQKRMFLFVTYWNRTEHDIRTVGETHKPIFHAAAEIVIFIFLKCFLSNLFKKKKKSELEVSRTDDDSGNCSGG